MTELYEKLEKYAPLENFYFTGSVSLNVYNIVNRKIKDIDIVCNDIIFENMKVDFAEEPLSSAYLDGESHISFKLTNGMSVDIFKASGVLSSLINNHTDINYFSVVNHRSRKLSILKPSFSINAKLKFIESYMESLKGGGTLTDLALKSFTKHVNDINVYNQGLWKLFSIKKNIDDLF